MRSIVYEKYLSPWERDVRSAVIGGTAVILIIFFLAGTVLQNRMDYMSVENNKVDYKPAVLGASDVAISDASLSLRDYGDGNAVLNLKISNTTAPVYADLIITYENSLSIIRASCRAVSTCSANVEEGFIQITLRGYVPELESAFEDELVDILYEQSTGGTLYLDNQLHEYSYLIEQGESVNLLSGKHFEFPMGTYFK